MKFKISRETPHERPLREIFLHFFRGNRGMADWYEGRGGISGMPYLKISGFVLYAKRAGGSCIA